MLQRIARAVGDSWYFDHVRLMIFGDAKLSPTTYDILCVENTVRWDLRRQGGIPVGEGILGKCGHGLDDTN